METPFSSTQKQCNNNNEGNTNVGDNLQCDTDTTCTTCTLDEMTSTSFDKRGTSASVETALIGITTEILPIGAHVTLLREDNCNDGKDDDRDGLKDLQDPDCTLVLNSELKRSPLITQDVNGYSNTTSNSSSTNSPVQLKGSVVLKSLMVDDSSNNVHTITMTAPANRDIRTVSSVDSGFSYQELEIKNGDKVVWINQDPSGSHGIVLVDKVLGKIIYQEPDIRFNEIASYMFETNGEFTFYDSSYYSMTGKIIVEN